MTARPKLLRIVEEAPKDVTMLLRADINARDWAAVHVAGDRRAPVFLPDVVKRWWLR
jgi:hypothetical protein